MGTLKCCVGGCNATSETNRLFCFPKKDYQRSLWMSFLVPTNPLLLGLSVNQLMKKRVCEKHFDRTQFDPEGKRIAFSYPCLFTEKEIALGEPLNKEEWSIFSEHNYFQMQDENEVEDISQMSLVIGRADDPNFCEHPTTSSQSNSSIVINKGLGDPNLPSCSFDREPKLHAEPEPVGHPSQSSRSFDEVPNLLAGPKPMEIDSNTGIQINTRSAIPFQGQKQKFSIAKKLSSKRRKYIKSVIKISSESLGQPGAQRIEEAQNVAQNEELLKNFNLLPKQAKSFLLMQLKQVRKNKMARRFTIEEKLMALLLMKQSPKGYKLLEKMFALPSKRTLSRLAGRISIEPGLNPEVFKYIQQTTKNWDEKKKLCTLVFDEVSLTPHLTFDENKDRINGFVDIGGQRKQKFCDHALVFMIRGVCFPWRQCVSYYFCEGTISAADLQNILKQIISQIVQTGLIPLGLICDQGSTFRTAIKKLRESTIRSRTIKGIHDDGSVNIAGHDLNIFYDPPHLLKGIRNNFLNKDIVWENKIATWNDIKFIYNIDSQLGHTRALPKLTANHIDPKKAKKMKVSIAAQVLSARTAAMLKYTGALQNVQGNEKGTTMETTAEVVEFFDNLFDSVNGYPGGAVRGKLRRAIKPDSVNIEFWKDAIKKLKKLRYKDSTSKLAIKAGKPLLVKVPSLNGWITTLSSFLRLSEILFKKYGLDYYYPRNINQDPLENFFGRVRSINYRNVNPDPNTFIYGFKSLLLSNILSVHSRLANCEEDNGETLLDINYLFEEKKSNEENILPINVSSLPSSSVQDRKILMEQVISEKIKVHCSAYTAGYICRKISKSINCKQCAKTYTTTEHDNIHQYIKLREYKLLKNSNLCYPNSKFLILYRDGAQLVHNYLNSYCHLNGVGRNLRHQLEKNFGFSWLGCAKHKESVKSLFLRILIRVQGHNSSNIINKILTGKIEEKYVQKMNTPQKLALSKFKKIKSRKRGLNK